MTQEYDGPPSLRERVIAIICKEWPNEDNELQSTTIYHQLVSGGVGVSETALRDVLERLAGLGDIELVISPTVPLAQGGVTIRGVSPELCP